MRSQHWLPENLLVKLQARPVNPYLPILDVTVS